MLSSAHSCNSQPLNDSSLVGTWKGTSICQVKPSPCNDEIAIYHVSKKDKPNSYHMVMNKIVNGKEEDMGECDYLFNRSDGSFSGHDEKYGVSWTFTIKGKNMEGELLRDKVVIRKMKLTKISDQF
jgi:hypothetical protein